MQKKSLKLFRRLSLYVPCIFLFTGLYNSYESLICVSLLLLKNYEISQMNNLFWSSSISTYTKIVCDVSKVHSSDSIHHTQNTIYYSSYPSATQNKTIFQKLKLLLALFDFTYAVLQPTYIHDDDWCYERYYHHHHTTTFSVQQRRWIIIILTCTKNMNIRIK